VKEWLDSQLSTKSYEPTDTDGQQPRLETKASIGPGDRGSRDEAKLTAIKLQRRSEINYFLPLLFDYSFFLGLLRLICCKFINGCV
jgi:hypothetical protein